MVQARSGQTLPAPKDCRLFDSRSHISLIFAEFPQTGFDIIVGKADGSSDFDTLQSARLQEIVDRSLANSEHFGDFPLGEKHTVHR